jgi:hypothetical protein
MGITVAARAQYENAVKKLFPQGAYWDGQFSDPASDVSIFIKAKADELTRFRGRMGSLCDESRPETAGELIEDWERALLGYLNGRLPLEERRRKIIEKESPPVSRSLIAGVAEGYGLTLADIIFPFKASFFGFSKFGRSVFSRPAFYSVFYIITAFQDEDLRTEAAGRVTALVKNASFGRARFGAGQFLGRSFFIKDYSSRVFSGIKTLGDFERDVNSKLIASNIAYFLYKL